MDRQGIEVGIVADDFTSAMDAAGPFARRGLDATVLRAPCSRDGGGCAVLAVDADSRRRDAAAAATAVAASAAALADAPVLVKTVDSTLRGHVAAEIAAALAASGRRLAVVAPAFPAGGRTTVGGVQLVGGRPVAATEFARDPRHPVADSRVAALLRAGGIEPLTDADVGAGAAGALVADAATDADLDAVVAGAGGREDVLWVGSPGLAAALARTRERRAAPAPPRARRVAVVVGSRHPVNAAQVDRLAAHLGARLVTATAGSSPWPPPLGGAVDTVVLTAPPSAGPISEREGAVMARALGRDAATIVAENGFDGVLAIGGETAAAVVEALGGDRVRLVDEPQPGIALGLVGEPPVAFATKAGGFGDEHALVRLHATLTGPAR